MGIRNEEEDVCTCSTGGVEAAPITTVPASSTMLLTTTATITPTTNEMLKRRASFTKRSRRSNSFGRRTSKNITLPSAVDALISADMKHATTVVNTDEMLAAALDLSEQQVMVPPPNSFGTPMPSSNRRKGATSTQPMIHHSLSQDEATSIGGSSSSFDSSRKRIVRFADDENLNKVYPSTIVLTEIDIAKGWWPGYDIQRTARNSRLTVAYYLQKGQPLRKQIACNFLRVIQLCMDAKDNNGHEEIYSLEVAEVDQEEGEGIDGSDSTNITNKNNINNDIISLLTVGKDMILPLIGDETNKNHSTVGTTTSITESRTARGLELQMAPVLKCIRRYHTRAVLGCARSTNEQHQKLLVTRSRQFSRPLKILARIIGQADELAIYGRNHVSEKKLESKKEQEERENVNVNVESPIVTIKKNEVVRVGDAGDEDGTNSSNTSTLDTDISSSSQHSASSYLGSSEWGTVEILSP